MIDTTNEKLALMEEEVWEPALPLSPSTLGQDDLQQLLWGYPGLLWTTATLQFILDMNTRIFVYLCSLYSADPATSDNTALTRRYLDAATGDANARFQALISAATV